MSVSTPSSPSLPSISLPTTPTTPSSDPTLSHLLNLPPLLQPISPSLAALHLARVRLSLSLPTSPRYSSKSTLSQWCNLCGGLRSNLGGAESSPKLGESSQSKHPLVGKNRLPRRNPICGTCGESYKKPIPNPQTLKEYPPARKTRRITRSFRGTSERRDTIIKLWGSGNSSSVGDTNTSGGDTKELVKQGQTGVELLEEKTTNNGLSPPGQLDITVTGNSDGIDDQSENITKKKNNDNDTSSIINPINQTSETPSRDPEPIKPNVEPMEIDQPSPSSPSLPSLPSSSTPQTPIPTPPKLLSRPSLSHIPKSSPNLPTYPPPPPKPITISNIVGKKSISTGAGVKRKKKSGLAKLLAENKERELVNKNNGSMWGL